MCRAFKLQFVWLPARVDFRLTQGLPPLDASTLIKLRYALFGNYPYHFGIILMDPAIAVLVSAGLATTGWLYTARRARMLSRKQHTVNVMLQASFNKDFQDCISHIRPFILERNLSSSLDDPVLQDAIRRVLNHYEFIAAGLRNGDFDEQLVLDSQRALILQLWNGSAEYIWALRNSRDRMSLYEHLEWLTARWDDAQPRPFKKLGEQIAGRPWQGARHRHKKSVAS